MTTLRHLTVEEVTSILSRGAFAELISAVEHVQFECKGGFYDTQAVKSKIELAKEVSALANASGGYVLIGPATTKNPLHQQIPYVDSTSVPQRVDRARYA